MITQFFVLSPRGDAIISKQYRGDAVAGIAEIFFRKVKFWEGGDAPPVFNVDNTHFLYVKKNGLYFVVTTKFNVSPAMTLELIERLTKVFKDYCGVLTEESMKKNFILIYELLDEVIDYGYPQGTSTELLKAHVYNEPIVVEAARSATFKVPTMSAKTTPSSAVHKPISLAGRKGRKNEIFVDILERLTVLFNSNGYILNSTIDGCIQMKSYLSGNPPLRLALNEDLSVGKGSGGGGYGGVVLDDCNFHECVNLDQFQSARTLSLIPPDGEFVVMNYRITGDFRAPFRIFPIVEETSAHKVELILKIRADIPENNYGANVTIRFPVPRNAATVHPELMAASAVTSGPRAAVPGTAVAGGGTGGQAAEYRAKDRQVIWQIKKFVGGTEHTLRTRITLSAPSTSSVRKEMGPIGLTFEIPMYNVSHLQVRYLRIAEAHKSYKPYRWVRYVTQSTSYMCRL